MAVSTITITGPDIDAVAVSVTDGLTAAGAVAAYDAAVDVATQAEAEAGTSTTVKRWTPQRVGQAIDALAASAADLTSHTSNTSNPHSVTKAQVGLTNADDTSDANKPVSTATQTALDLKATAADLTSHTGNTSNPHGVTKAQVGLTNVTDHAQTQAAIVPNTAPSAGQILAGNAGGTAYAPVSVSGDATIASTGAVTLSTVNSNVGEFTNATVTVDAKGRITAASSGTPGSTSADEINIDDAGEHFTGTEVEAALQESGSRLAALESVVPPAPSGNALHSGGGVSLVTDLTINVSAATYTIQGTSYASPEDELTADAADETNPRIDVVAVNTSNVAVIITGTPAATPVKPDVDPTTQLELTFFVVAAGATSLATNVVDVYRENTEYTMTENGTSITLDSTNNPHLGTKCIEATSAGNGDYFQAEAGANIDLGDYESLVFFIRNKASWAAAKQITITARLAGVQKGSSITFKNGLFAFDQTNTTTYQQIVIPTSLFSANGQEINQLRFAVAGGGAAIGFYVDDITLQGGLAPTVDATRLKDRGPWSEDLLYNINDMVDDEYVLYVALQSGTNKQPKSNIGTYWRVRAMLNPMTAAADLIVGGTSGAPARLAKGTALQVLRVNAGETALEYAAASGGGSKTLCRFVPADNHPPLTNYATWNLRSTIPVLEFDDTTAESAVFLGVIPQGADLSSGIKRREFWMGKTATSGTVMSTGAFERCTTDLDSDSFATGIDSSATSTNATSGIITVIETSHSSSEIDGLAVGDSFRLKITRKVASDDMAGDAQLVAVELQQIA